jgi:Flp pilus assembly protein TadD
LADKALENSQGAAGVYAARGRLRYAFGRHDEAFADFDKAIELEPQNPGLWMHRALCYIDQGRGEQALADFTKALESRPDSADACNNLAWYLATCSDPRVRQPDRAVKLATKATQLAPGNGMSWNTLGVALYRVGDYKATVDALTNSMQRRSGGDAFDWFFLAMAHWQLGNNDEAQQWYDKALEWMETNKPDDEELVRFRAEAAELLGITETPAEKPAEEEQAEPAKTNDSVKTKEVGDTPPGDDSPPAAESQSE